MPRQQRPQCQISLPVSSYGLGLYHPPGSSTVFVSGSDGNIRLCNLATSLAVQSSATMFDSPIRDFSVCNGGNVVVAVSADGFLSRWDCRAPAGEFLALLSMAEAPELVCAVSIDSSDTFLAMSDGPEVAIFDLRTASPKQSVPSLRRFDYHDEVTAVRWSPFLDSGSILVSGGIDGCVNVIDVTAKDNDALVEVLPVGKPIASVGLVPRSRSCRRPPKDISETAAALDAEFPCPLASQQLCVDVVTTEGGAVLYDVGWECVVASATPQLGWDLPVAAASTSPAAAAAFDGYLSFLVGRTAEMDDGMFVENSGSAASVVVPFGIENASVTGSDGTPSSPSRLNAVPGLHGYGPSAPSSVLAPHCFIEPRIHRNDVRAVAMVENRMLTAGEDGKVIFWTDEARSAGGSYRVNSSGARMAPAVASVGGPVRSGVSQAPTRRLDTKPYRHRK